MDHVCQVKLQSLPCTYLAHQEPESINYVHYACAIHQADCDQLSMPSRGVHMSMVTQHVRPMSNAALVWCSIYIVLSLQLLQNCQV